MSQIRIVNWLLTRRCNLHCDYCAIVKNYDQMPPRYPGMNHYIKNEMSTDVVIKALGDFKKHNPEAFHLFYGGEPLLRKDLPDIINYCNENDIHYTIISNNTTEVQPLIKNLFDKTEYISGFTSSIDPIIGAFGDPDKDRLRKTNEGWKRLLDMQAKGKVKDVVAEITVMNDNVKRLPLLVEMLSDENIYSDITFVDIAKNKYYDFSNVTDPSQLVKPNWDLASILMDMYNDKSLLIHMTDVLFPAMFNTLPSNMDCGLEKGVHNITVDADGSIRLCLRIRGTLTPKLYNVENLFDIDRNGFQDCISYDKRNFCELCNHSCLIMSKYIDESGDGEDDLVHSDKRETIIDG